MKRRLTFSLIVLGISSLIAQVLLVREVMMVFYGNEFFLGWTLFSWLFWISTGSLLFSRLIRFTNRLPRLLILCHAAITVLFPAAIWIVRASRLIVSPVPGQAPDLLPSLGFTFVALAPICLAASALFITAAKTWKVMGNPESLSNILGRSYMLETLGFVFGGMLFGYALVTADEFRVSALVQWLNVAACAVLYASPFSRSLITRLALAGAAAAATVVLSAAPRLSEHTTRYRFPGQQVLESRNSVHGNIAVTRMGNQYSFYQSGLLIGSEEEALWNEHLAHLPLLFHPAPSRVLLIGGGLTGVLSEILKHQPERVDYLELDPTLVEITRIYLPAEERRALDDLRVRIITQDGRFFMNRLAAGGNGEAVYDVIIVNLPNPSTILINRLYTEEFFRLARSLLKPGGLLSTHLAFSPDYLSPELEDLGASLFRTMTAVFDSVIVLPEYAAFFIASPDQALAYDPGPLVSRFIARGINANYLSVPYLEYRLTTDRITQVVKAFEENPNALPNRDRRPVACYYNLVHWISSLHPQAARLMSRAGKIRPFHLSGALFVFFILLLIRVRRVAGGGSLWAMGTASFTLMACEIIIILGFQIFYGYLYYRISLIIACLMLGMAAGSWAAVQVQSGIRPVTLVKLHTSLAVYAAFLIPLFSLLAPAMQRNALAIQVLFLGLAALLGGLVGFEYPAVNTLYLSAHKDDHRRAGWVYAVDVIGSCAGALLISMWLLPVIGLSSTLAALCVLNTITATALWLGKSGR